MLEFIIGRAGSGKSSYCLQSVTKELQKAGTGRKIFLILPEHMTFRTEWELARRQSGGGFSRAYVYGFRRLARQVLLETGGAALPRLTEVGQRLLYTKVLTGKKKELRLLGRAARQRNFTQSLAGMVEELKSYAVSPEMLQSAGEQMPEGEFRDKLADLAAVYQGICKEMEGRYNDAEDLLTAFAGKIPESSLLAGAEIWLDGFVFFNPQERMILQALLQTAANVHVTLCLENTAMENAEETALFHRQWQTLQMLQRLAGDLDLPVQVKTMENPVRYKEKALAHLEQHLFSYPLQKCAQGQGIRLVEAANRRQEVEAIAADLLSLCREKGWRWRDIGILIRDQQAYLPVFKTVCSQYQIPCFMDGSRERVHHPLTELLRSALEVLRGWRYEPLFRCLKTDFFPVTRHQIDRLENYVLAFGIRGNRWKIEDDWMYWRRHSLEENEMDEQQREELAEVNHIRRIITGPLLQLEENIKKAVSVREQTEALYLFLQELEIEKTLQQWQELDEKQGNLDMAQEHAQIWKEMISLFDQMVDTSGDENLSLEIYEEILNDGLDSIQIRMIPPGLDYVTVASLDQNSLENAKAVYIVGANEGSMPRHVSREGLLNDAERQHLLQAGIELSGGKTGEAFAEKFLLYRGFTEAAEYLHISYPLSAGDGTAMSASPLFRKLRKMLPESCFTALPPENLTDRERLVQMPRPTAGHLLSALRAYRETGVMEDFWRDVYNWLSEDAQMQPALDTMLQGLGASFREEKLPDELARNLYAKNGHLRGSVTRFESYRACPFRHFSQYGLRLEERAEYRFAAPDLGNLLHGTMKEFGERLQQDKRLWQDVSDKECEELCQSIVQELAPRLQNEILLSSAQYQHLLQRIEKTAFQALKRLIDFAGTSEFSPVRLEQSFGFGKEGLPPLQYLLEHGIEMEIIGQIDRIDQAANGAHFLIIDYKTGNAYLNILEVYHGLQLQLLTYLLVAWNASQNLFGHPCLPAGMLYYFLKNPVLTRNYPLTKKEAEAELQKQLKMPGWLLADPELIGQIDASARFIRVQLKKDGDIPATARSQVKSPEEFSVLLSYIDHTLAEIGQEILQGDASAKPYRLPGKKNACEYCLYRSVCQFDPLLPGYEYRNILPAGEDEILEKMKKEAEGCSGQKNSRKQLK